eukprot:8676705-Karenia_brevis.AAC.1
MLARGCSRALATRIRKDFGQWVHLVTGKGTCVNGTLHVEEVIPNVIAKLAQRIRAAHHLCQDQDQLAKIMYVEDEAPSHCGDECKQTADVGLKSKRNKAFGQFGL